jgi:hypothetical protein
VKFNRLNSVFYKELKVHLAENNTVGFWHYLQPSARHPMPVPKPVTQTTHGFRCPREGTQYPPFTPTIKWFNHLRLNAYENKTRTRRK